MRDRRYPEQVFRSCMGILRLAKPYGREPLDAACAQALELNVRSYSSVKSILQNGLDRRGLRRLTEAPTIKHSNIRGADYFH